MIRIEKDDIVKLSLMIIFASVLSILASTIAMNMMYDNAIINQNTKSSYEKFMNKNLDDKQSIYYSKICSGMVDEVGCVMTETKQIYNYVNRTGIAIRTPSQYSLKGGDCQDSAIFYATIFKNMNYTINFRFPIPTHVSITIVKKMDDNITQYCDIEGNSATCYEVLS
jgi:hypothetical protein